MHPPKSPVYCDLEYQNICDYQFLRHIMVLHIYIAPTNERTLIVYKSEEKKQKEGTPIRS